MENRSSTSGFRSDMRLLPQRLVEEAVMEKRLLSEAVRVFVELMNESACARKPERPEAAPEKQRQRRRPPNAT